MLKWFWRWGLRPNWRRLGCGCNESWMFILLMLGIFWHSVNIPPVRCVTPIQIFIHQQLSLQLFFNLKSGNSRHSIGRACVLNEDLVLIILRSFMQSKSAITVSKTIAKYIDTKPENGTDDELIIFLSAIFRQFLYRRHYNPHFDRYLHRLFK